MSVILAVAPRIDIMRRMEAALRLMTGTRPWGGSYANAPTVERAYKTIQQVNQFPHLCLLPYVGSRVTPATHERFDDFYAALVIGYVQGTTDVPVTEMVDHLNRDVKMTLLQVTAPGLLRDVMFDEEAVDFYPDNGLAEFHLPFTAHLQDALD